MLLRKLTIMQNTQMSQLLNLKATDTTPPTEPVVTNDLTGKATTKTPITVTTDPNTHVDLLDKDNHVIGSGTTDSNGRVTLHQRCLFLKVMYALKRR